MTCFGLTSVDSVQVSSLSSPKGLLWILYKFLQGHLHRILQGFLQWTLYKVPEKVLQWFLSTATQFSPAAPLSMLMHLSLQAEPFSRSLIPDKGASPFLDSAYQLHVLRKWNCFPSPALQIRQTPLQLCSLLDEVIYGLLQHLFQLRCFVLWLCQQRSLASILSCTWLCSSLSWRLSSISLVRAALTKASSSTWSCRFLSVRALISCAWATSRFWCSFWSSSFSRSSTSFKSVHCCSASLVAASDSSPSRHDLQHAVGQELQSHFGNVARVYVHPPENAQTLPLGRHRNGLPLLWVSERIVSPALSCTWPININSL